jgi:hypothetical protein
MHNYPWNFQFIFYLGGHTNNIKAASKSCEWGHVWIHQNYNFINRHSEYGGMSHNPLKFCTPLKSNYFLWNTQFGGGAILYHKFPVFKIWLNSGVDYKEYCFLGCHIRLQTFRRNGFHNLRSRRVGQETNQQKQEENWSQFADSLLSMCSVLKTEAVRSSETSANFYLTTRCHIPQDSTLQIRVKFESVDQSAFPFHSFSFRRMSLWRTRKL